MHGEAHDWVTLNTIKNGHLKGTGLTLDGGKVKDFDFYKKVKHLIAPIKTQRKFKKILDIGSLDYNGTQRTFNFIGNPPTWLDKVSDTGDYTGIDLKAGKSVDMVMNSHKLSFKSGTFDLVICLNMLEHDSNPEETIREAYRVLKRNGLFILVFSSETHPPHPQFGGGSEHYEGITEKRIKKMMSSKNCKIIKYGDDFYIVSRK